MQLLVASGSDATDEDIAAWYPFGPGVSLRANMIMSADGLAIGDDGLAKGLSGPEDGRLLGILRAVADAVIVAAGTLREEQYNPIRTRQSLRGYRAAAGMSEHPVLVMVTRVPKVDQSFEALARAPVRPLVVCASNNGALSDVAEVIECPDGHGGVDLTAAVAALQARGLARLHTEGGPHLLAGLLAAGLVDEYCLAISPQVLGGGPGLRPVTGSAAVTGFALEHTAIADNFVFLRYRRAAT